MNRVKIVMLETLKTHLKSGAFWAMILLPIVFGIIGGLGGYFAGTSDDNPMALIVTEELKPYFNEEDYKFIDEEQLDSLIDSKDVTSYAKISEENGQVVADLNDSDLDMVKTLTFQESLNTIQSQLNAKNASLDQDQEEILAKTPIINKIEDEKTDNKMIGQLIYFVLIFLMYMVLMSFVNLVLSDIATEKGTKMIEFIFSSVRPGDYFAGKMLGNFIAVFVQIITYVIFGLIGFFIVKSRGLFDGLDLSFTLTSSSYGIIAEIVALFLLGIFIFLVIAGMLGSFATKVEDAGKMGTPLIFVTIILFFLAMSLQKKGDIMLTQVLSYIPLASTFFMPLRLLNGYAGLSQGLISIAILIVTIFLVYRFGEKVYKRNILNYSTDNWFARRFKK
ncbi:ABC transporter permease [Anaerococcus sp. ENR0831]|uniref:ABC transporter permease n=1 Tax=Anaerococcus martiniensis TaxID=3115615 RepID=A0ABW9M9N2_9FIRM